MVAMSEKSFVRRRWKLILNIVTLAALAGLVYFIWDDIVETYRNIGRVNAWILLLLLPMQLLNYHAQTKLYQHLFKIVGNKLSYRSLFRTSLELNFVNHVFPSGGVTGISYFGLRLRDGEKLTAAKATLVQVMKLGLTFLSFEVLIILGLLSLASMGKANNITIMVAASLSTLLLVGTGLFIYIVGSQSRINQFFTGVTKGLNRLIQIIRPKHPETINISSARTVFDDFHKNYKEIKSKSHRLRAPFWYALLINVTEVASIYVVYAAFSEFVNIGAVILAYAVANFAGLVSVLPGGVGIYEALMTAVLASAGVPARLSLPVTVMYRVLNTLIQVIPGYYFYQKTLKETKTRAAAEHPSG